jgi:hypothetical protein
MVAKLNRDVRRIRVGVAIHQGHELPAINGC